MAGRTKTGSQTLLRELFKLVASGTVTVPANNEVSVVVEDFPGDNQHVFYLTPSIKLANTSVWCSQDGAPQSHLGTFADIVCGTFSRRSSDGAGNLTTQVFLRLSNFGGTDRDVEYRMYRVVGLKG